jgi:hypothetical protein
VSKQPVDDQMITEYLLGSLPETEVERLDEMILTDISFAKRLQAVENDLVDAYVRGGLSEETFGRFKSHYLASSKRREKVTFAETFCQMIDKFSFDPIEAPGISVESHKPRWFRFFVVPRPVLQWAFATVSLLLLLAGVYLMFENVSLRKQRALTQAGHSEFEKRQLELQGQLARQRSSDTEKENELARMRDRLTQLEQQIASSEQPNVKIIALNLPPQIRGESELQPDVPAGTNYVVLTLEVDVYDFSAYYVTLKDPSADKVLWHSEKLSAGRKSKVIQVTMPTSKLMAQDYVLELFGVSESGVTEIVGSYRFRVLKE